MEVENNQELDVDFDAGFNSDSDATTTPQSEDQVDSVIKEKVIPEAPKLAQITEQQFQELLADASSAKESKAETKRLLDSAFGKIGGMKQLIEQMQSSTPQGQPIIATEEDFAEMKADFPEFADQQRKALNKVLGKIKGTGSWVDPSSIERLVEERTAKVRDEFIDTQMESVLENWVDQINTPEFDNWEKEQPDDIKALRHSSKMKDATRMLTLFKAHKETPVPVAKTSTRQQQIAAAIAPKSLGGYTPKASDDDDFESGFKSAHT